MSNEFPTTPERSRIMRAIKSKDTRPELALRSACHRLGLRHRCHVKSLPGTPDFAYASAKVAVFVDGDFWHGRKWFEDGVAPKRNREAWLRKFKGNRDRDRRVDGELAKMGWLPLRVWESDVKGRLPVAARLVRMTVNLRKQFPHS